MTPHELIKSAEKDPVTEADIKAFEATLNNAEKKFKQEAASQFIDEKWLSRSYTV